MRRIALALTLVSASFAFGEETPPSPVHELKVNLKDPEFHQGVIKTSKGGIIESEGMRIQAQNLEYLNRTENGLPVKKVIAEGNLLLEYAGRAFVGRKLEYDFVTKKGTLWDGRTATDFWFIGGDEIELEPDGSLRLNNAYVTTVEGQDQWWELRSSSIDINDKNMLAAQGIKFNFFRIPVLWLPSFKINMKFLKDPPIKYRVLWDQVLREKITMRYELYSTETFSLYGRLDYRFRYGPGAAIETNYRSLDRRTLFQTKSYGAFDKLIPQERGDKRFRLQGLFDTHTRDEKTHVHMTYDRLSDDKMPQDFKAEDFEVDTQMRTILWATHQHRNFFSRFVLQPRINGFQSINQQLPFVMTSVRPFQLGSTGIISENTMSAGYLDYVFGEQLASQLHSTHSARLETNNSLYRPFPVGPFTLTPSIGVVGIFYSNTQKHHAAGQGIFSYNLEANTRLYRNYPTVRHIAEPYILYQGLTRPQVSNNNHYFFSIDDGYTTLNTMRMGVRQSFYSTRHPQFFPDYSVDLFTYGYFGETAFGRTFPKAYTQFEMRRPSVLVRGGVGYNFQQQLFDYTNILTGWTVSEDLALGLEFRHRSRYDWRKADHENFILDVYQPISDLIHSPISDGRNTLLAKIQMRLAPLWTLNLQSHLGWGRKNEPNYNEMSAALTTYLSSKWTVTFTYGRTADHRNHFDFHFNLLP
jgi:hypothetical protein